MCSDKKNPYITVRLKKMKDGASLGPTGHAQAAAACLDPAFCLSIKSALQKSNDLILLFAYIMSD